MEKLKIDIIVEARMDSTRLPGKVLLPIVGKPVLGLMVERLKRVSNISEIIIATTTKEVDNKIVELAHDNGVRCYRGSESDVLGRVLESAIYFDTDVIVEVTGDNPLSDPILIESMIDKFIKLGDSVDFISNDVGCYNNSVKIEFPLGLNVKIFKTSVLSEVESKAKSPVDREHVVNYILKNMDKYRVYNYKPQGFYCRPDLRFTMDYKEDYILIKEVYKALYNFNNNFTSCEIIDFLDANPIIKNGNIDCVQNRYQ
jgi:spore coat polysaccharide biosynthesis protein SpsF